jgi:ferritin-like protein
MANSVGFHESEDRLTPLTRDLHRALTSLQEELEAIDWYQQRIDATHDEELRDVLRHARDEEMEHATMVLEWIRRKSPEFDATLRARLFSSGSILEREEELEREEVLRETAPGPQSANGAQTPRATVGSLREAR